MICLEQADAVVVFHCAKTAATEPALGILDPPTHRCGPEHHELVQILIDRSEHRIGAYQLVAGVNRPPAVGGALRHWRRNGLCGHRKSKNDHHSVNSSANAIANVMLSTVQTTVSMNERA